MFRRAYMGWFGLLILSAATGLPGEVDPVWIQGCFTGGSPRPVNIAETAAWQQASALAENTPTAFVLVGTGRSMHPLYGAGTILVLQKPPYGELRCGQTVLYRTKHQKIVAHLLVAKVRDGWRARGLNNALHDMEPVNADNLVGIVIAAFQPGAPDRTVQLVTQR